MASSSSPVRAIMFAFSANFAIALAKTAAAVITASSSMVAEAIHSYADSANQLLLLLGLKRALRPPDTEHPLGYGKVSYFWSFIVALSLKSNGVSSSRTWRTDPAVVSGLLTATFSVFSHQYRPPATDC